MDPDTSEALTDPAVVAQVVALVMEDCRRYGWTIDATKPAVNNPDAQYVAHIRRRDGEAVGLGMSTVSSSHAICAAFRSAWGREWA